MVMLGFGYLTVRGRWVGDGITVFHNIEHKIPHNFHVVTSPFTFAAFLRYKARYFLLCRMNEEFFLVSLLSVFNNSSLACCDFTPCVW